ncbi:MAG TPA: FAD-dependent monooxygenase [Burkholderiaceae bacterium]|nr:FAD-dependent monooxygenase [Burkholderiaceae bacterium]
MSAAIETKDVVVVGAGVAGMAAALGFAHAGLQVALVGPAPRVFARSAAAPFDERIYALAPSSIALFGRLRVWPHVDAARMQAVARMRVFGDAGDELDFDAYGAAVERLATIGEEAELLRVLTAACAFAAGLDREIASFVSMRVEGGDARVDLAGGRTIGARLVVAADGAGSAVRAAAGISAEEHVYGQTAVVANFRAQRAHDGTAFQWFTAEGVVALLPLPDHAGEPAVSLVWSAPAELATKLLELESDDLARRVTARTAAMLGDLSPLGRARGFPLRQLKVARLVGPRVALVGDAAHVVHPLAGQGLNLGLADVSELVAVTAGREVFRDTGDPVILRRYARRRAEPIGLMRMTTDGLARLFEVDDPIARRLRNGGMALVNQIGPLKRALIRHALG